MEIRGDNMADKKRINSKLLSAYYVGGSLTGMNDTDIRRRMDDLEQRVDALDTQLTALDQRVDGIDTQISSINTRLTTIETQISAINTRLTNIETEYLKVRDQA